MKCGGQGGIQHSWGSVHDGRWLVRLLSEVDDCVGVECGRQGGSEGDVSDSQLDLKSSLKGWAACGLEQC